jgi:hypothetical protein
MKKNKANIKKAIKLMGMEPINPIGECFESSTLCLLDPTLNGEIRNLKELKLCHGVGTANMPGIEGKKIAHGWIECTKEDGKRWAIDTTWGVGIPASIYRKQLKISYIIEYTPFEAFKLWIEKGVAPWDKKLKKIINKNKNKNERTN